MEKSSQTADSRGGVRLPGFAGKTVIVEEIGDLEYRVHLAFTEEQMPIKLSERDAKKVLEMIETRRSRTPHCVGQPSDTRNTMAERVGS